MVPEAFISSAVGDRALRLWVWLDLKAGESGVAKASYPEMAAAMECSQSTIQRCIKELLAVGWIARIREGKGHGKAHYGVQNPARRPFTVDDAKGTDTVVSEDEADESSTSTREAVAVSPVAPLLGSPKDLGWDQDRSARDDRADDPVAKFVSPLRGRPPGSAVPAASSEPERSAVLRLLQAFPGSTVEPTGLG